MGVIQIINSSLSNAFNMSALVFLLFIFGYLYFLKNKKVEVLKKSLISIFVIGVIFHLFRTWAIVLQNFGYPVLGTFVGNTPAVGFIYWVSKLVNLLVFIKIVTIAKILLLLFGIFYVILYFKKDNKNIDKIEEVLLQKPTQIILYIIFVGALIPYNLYNFKFVILITQVPQFGNPLLNSLIYSIVFILPFFILMYTIKKIQQNDKYNLVLGVLMIILGIVALIL